MHALAVLLSGLVAGGILFQSAVNAPLIFNTLEIAQARPLLRAIFPRLFRVSAALGVLLFAVVLMADLGFAAFSAAVVTVLFSVIAAALVPATNRAADDGDQEKFKALHRISVLLTMVVLLVNLGWPFLI
ncbi:MAG: DUF4149 domain-containing protein [Pseudomonadota bacterium]